MPRRLPPLIRNEVRIRLRNQRLDLLGPRREFRRQLRPLIRLNVRKVLGLPDIFLQIIELFVAIFKEPNQLPITVPRAGTGRSALVAVVGIMPLLSVAFPYVHHKTDIAGILAIFKGVRLASFSVHFGNEGTQSQSIFRR